MQQHSQTEPERVLWKGHPTQWLNFNTFFFCVLAVGFIAYMPRLWELFFKAQIPQYKEYYFLSAKILFFVPIIYGIWTFLKTQCHQYEITTERMREYVGVLNRHVDELELYRVKDITMSAPFTLRMIGCANIIMDTSDKSTPIVVIYGVENARETMDKLRIAVDIMRTRKGVREID